MRTKPRSNWLVLLLYSPGTRNRVNEPIIGSIRIMKGLFLMKQEVKIRNFDYYKFEPYLYGPMSVQVYRDLKTLTMKGVIQKLIIANKRWDIFKLTYRGCKRAERLWESLPGSTQKSIIEIKREINSRSFLSLLEYVYNKYPKFAKQSIIKV